MYFGFESTGSCTYDTYHTKYNTIQYNTIPCTSCNSQQRRQRTFSYSRRVETGSRLILETIMPTLIVTTRLPVGPPTAINNDTSVLISNGLRLAIESLTNLVQENFQCSMCLHNCTDARVIPECLHRFCGNCIEEGIGKCGNECPSFGTRITSKCDLRLDAQSDNIVSAHTSSS